MMYNITDLTALSLYTDIKDYCLETHVQNTLGQGIIVSSH